MLKIPYIFWGYSIRLDIFWGYRADAGAQHMCRNYNLRVTGNKNNNGEKVELIKIKYYTF